MSSENYQLLTTTDQIEANRVNCFTVDGQSVVVTRIKDEYFAVENRCSHAEQTFDTGRVRGHKLLCPLHGAIFDIRNGSVISAPAIKPVKSYPLRVESEQVFILLNDN